MAKNQLYYGDNLDVLRRYVPDETVDLVYLDPPFNSAQNYNVIFQERSGTASAAQIRAFEDTWGWDTEAALAYLEMVEEGPDTVSVAMQGLRMILGDSDMMAYLAMMAPRLVELRRVLRPTGSVFLHCDPTASHYLKVVMDAVFGVHNFRNEIIWHYKFRMMMLERFFNRKHDVILFYSKSEDMRINMSAVVEPWTREEIIKTRKQAIYEDDEGREWIWMPGGRGHSKNKPKYLDEIIKEGKARDDVWDIPIISSSAKERMGYPTQKPEPLLEIIVKAASNEGELVLDPFCGCGTTVAVAQKLGRRWIGIDITHLAINLIRHRLRNTYGEEIEDSYDVFGEPTTLEDARVLAEQDRHQFEWWALGLVGARPAEGKKGADQGIDGRLFFHDEGPKGTTKKVILSVKSGSTGAAHVRDLVGVLDREKAEIGVLITLQDPTKPMRKEAASAGFYFSPWTDRNHPRLQILTVKELLDGARIDMPETKGMNVTYKKAPRQLKKVAEQLNLDGES